MKTILLIILLTFAFSSTVFAKSESESKDAQSVVLYGSDGSNIYPVAVQADGTLEVA